MKDIKYIRPDFHPVARVMPQRLGVLGGQKISFLNMVMWHIKLKGMISRPGYTEKFYPRIKLVTLELGLKGQIPLDFFKSMGICDGGPSNVF